MRWRDQADFLLAKGCLRALRSAHVGEFGSETVASLVWLSAECWKGSCGAAPVSGIDMAKRVPLTPPGRPGSPTPAGLDLYWPGPRCADADLDAMPPVITQRFRSSAEPAPKRPRGSDVYSEKAFDDDQMQSAWTSMSSGSASAATGPCCLRVLLPEWRLSLSEEFKRLGAGGRSWKRSKFPFWLNMSTNEMLIQQRCCAICWAQASSVATFWAQAFGSSFHFGSTFQPKKC